MTVDTDCLDRARLTRLLAGDDRSTAEAASLAELVRRLVSPPPPDFADSLFPRWRRLRDRVIESAGGSDGEALEERFLELYAHIHMHEAPYTGGERRRLDRAGGYWSHAGGLSPILKAGRWIRPDSASVDLGAGNGLQGLLIQLLFPHRSCCQIEISSAMIGIGRRLQTWLGVPDDRVEWRCEDVLEAPIGGWGFVYLYRPVRPEGPGREFYRRLATALGAEEGEVVVFSIADCLRPFLPPIFERFYTDGHLTCYRKPPDQPR